jgi:hypothetical protein
MWSEYFLIILLNMENHGNFGMIGAALPPLSSQNCHITRVVKFQADRNGIIIPYIPLQTAYKAILPAWYNQIAQ